MKIVQNARFRSCAARFGQIAFLGVKVVKIVTLASNSLQNGETVRFSWKLYKTHVSGHDAARFGQIAICERQSCQNRHTGLKSSSKRGNRALSMTILQKRAQFSGFAQQNFRPVWRFWQLWRSKCDLAKTCCAWPENRAFCTIVQKSAFQVLRSTILRPKRDF